MGKWDIYIFINIEVRLLGNIVDINFLCIIYVIDIGNEVEEGFKYM